MYCYSDQKNIAFIILYKITSVGERQNIRDEKEK